MIKVIKLNKEEIYINADLIEMVEASPDTALILQSGKRIVVRDSVDEIVKQILAYKKYIHSQVTIKN